MIPSILKWIFIQYNKRVLKPKYFSGELLVEGLSKSVKIYRDRWHVPHIYAKTREDLFFAQGFIHAQDRMWQMEMNRRVAMGKLAEAFGEDALSTDRLTRTLGFNRLAAEDLLLLNDQNKVFLQSYSKGINEWLKLNKLPIEFLLSGIRPEPWEPIHSLGWGRVMAWTLSHGWSGTLIRREIIEKVGEEMANELGIYYPSENPVELPDGIEFNELSMNKIMEASVGPFLGKDMEGGGRGSNGWTVSGSLTDTGKPLLCNDTHLILQEPSVWYLNHLHSEDGFHVTGASLPGVDSCLIGHNENISWGMTLSYIDVEDIFVERIDPADPEKYLYKDESKEFEVIEEKILVKGKEPFSEYIRSTVHGPLIGEVTLHHKQTISLCSMALRPNRMFVGFMKLCVAENWDDFLDGVRHIDAPHLNIVYADIHGNIGLRVTGRVPVRGQGNAQLPVPGWTGEYDWIGEIPFDKMPQSFNPEQGYLITTNNKIISDDYQYFLGNSFMNGYRAQRIEEVFFSTDKISKEISAELHNDFKSIPGKKMLNGLISDFRTARPKVQKALDVLLKWDTVLDKESIGGTVYEILIYTMIRNLVEPHLGKDLTDRFMGNGEHPLLLPTSELLGHSTVCLFDIIQNGNSHWIINSKEAFLLVERSLEDTCSWLENNLGDDPEQWEWGKIHQAQFRHAMSIKKPMDKIFNVGPFPIGGDTDTVCQTAFNPATPYHATEWCPAFRMIVDLGDFSRSMIMNPAGQSGVLGDIHYDDFTEMWLRGEYIPMLWTKEEVEKNAEKEIKLSKATR